MATKIKPISIGNPQTGISDSPLTGWYDLRNVNIDNMPGVAQLNFRLDRQTKLPYSTTFTADVPNNKILFTDDTATTGVANGIETVRFSTTVSLPTGLSLSTNYWLNGLYPGKIYNSWYNAVNNSPITISSTGTGTHTLTYVTVTGTQHLYYDRVNSYLFIVTSTGQIWLNYNNTTFGLLNGNSLTNYETMIYWKGYYWFIGQQGIEANKLINDPSGTFVQLINSTYGYLVNGAGVWAGAYSGSNDYTIGQIVSYSGLYYICIQAVSHTATHTPTDTTYWTPTVTWDTTIPKKSFISQNNRLYINNGFNLIEIKENLSKLLDLGTNATFNYNYAVFSTSMPFYSTFLQEYNGTMYIGTNGKNIYTWDRSSLTWDMGATIEETYTYWMVNANNALYIGAGTSGNIYLSNGVTSNVVKTIPGHIVNKYYTSSTSPIIFSEATVIKDNILMPITISGDTGAIYSYNTVSNSLSILNEISNIHTNGLSTQNLLTSIVSLNNIDYYVAYSYALSNNSYISSVDSNKLRTTGQRVAGNGVLYNPYFGILSSSMVKVGVNRNKRTFEYLDVELFDLLGDGQGIAQYWRENKGDSYTLLKDVNNGGYTTYSPTPTNVHQANTKGYSFDFGVTVESFQAKTIIYNIATDSQNLTSPKFKVATIL